MIEYRVIVNLYNWTEIPEEQLNPMISRQMIHTETMTVARLRLRKGALVPLHNHINEQISMVERGKLRFVIAGEERIVTGGQIVAIPANAPHLVFIEDLIEGRHVLAARHNGAAHMLIVGGQAAG